ncbi:MAG: hypothetical protein E5Y12_05355 [Mesorhizobium sp.]|nr:MAG: hypothetical protein E5Y12_05355 [Mesorhizobium sp.]
MKIVDTRHADVINALKMVNRITPCPNPKHPSLQFPGSIRKIEKGVRRMIAAARIHAASALAGIDQKTRAECNWRGSLFASNFHQEEESGRVLID